MNIGLSRVFVNAQTASITSVIHVQNVHILDVIAAKNQLHPTF